MSSRRAQGDDGSSLIEYALLLALIAVVCVASIGYFGSGNGGSITKSANSIVTAGS